VRAGFHQRVRLGRLLERKAAIDHRLDPPRFQQRPDPVAQLGRDRGACTPSLRLNGSTAVYEKPRRRYIDRGQSSE
jgi:hypothetical protein